MPGFKQTDIGPIPADWDVKPLGGVLTAARLGGNYPNGPMETPFPLMKMGNLGRGQFDCSRLEYIVSPMIPKSTHQLRTGDVLFNTRNTLDLVGKVAIWRGELPVAYYNSNLMRLEFDRAVVCSNEYANYALNSEGAIARLRALATGTTSVAAIYTRDLRELLFVLPPTREQEAIASALRDVDALLVELRRLVDKKRDLKQAAMQQLLTGRSRLPGFHGDWRVRQLGEIGDLTGAGVDKKSRPGEPVVRLLNYMDVYKKDFIGSSDLWHEVTARPDQLRRCAVMQGDVFFTPTSEVRDDIGHSAVAIEDIPDAVYSYHVVRLRLFENWDLYFRAYAFRTKSFTDQASMLCEGSGTRYVITMPKFRSIQVLVPSDIREQAAIGRILSDMDAEIAALESRLEKTKALKQAMMQELLTGRTRLVTPAPVHA